MALGCIPNVGNNSLGLDSLPRNEPDLRAIAGGQWFLDQHDIPVAR